ncbi:MAG: PAS domain S-box protein [Bacteroidia bacterium]
MEKKILIVEDETVIAMDLQMSLERFGYRVIAHVTRGEDVIETFNSVIPDLILMDIKLEGTLDGVETAQLIHENYNIPVIFITSYSNSDIIERAKKANPFGYIVKPFNDRELRTNIEIAIYKHETELKLKESEKKYRELSESIQQIIIECDFQGALTYVNQSGLEFLGLNYGEYLNGVILTDFISEESFNSIKKRIDNASSESYYTNREYLIKNKFGKHYFIEEYLSPVYSQGALTGFRGILIDITSKRLKETLYALYNKLILQFNKDSTEPIEVINYLLAEFKTHFVYLEEVYFNEILKDKKVIKVHKDGLITSRPLWNGHSEYVITGNKAMYLRGKDLLSFNRNNKIEIIGTQAVFWCGFPLKYLDSYFGVFVFQSFQNENALTRGDFENLSTFFDNVNSLFERISYLKYIRQSEEKYKHLVNSINEGLIQSDLKGNVTFVNRQLTEITGYSSEEFIGRNLIHSLNIKDESRARLKRELFKRKSDTASQYELNVMSHSGKPLHLVVNGSSFKNAEGKVIGSIATVIDVTEKKEYLKLIKESEQKFKTIFQQAAVGVAIVNSTNGNLLDVNRKYCEIFGYSKEELVKMNFRQFTYADDLTLDLQQMELLKQGRIREFTLEERHITKKGELVWINLTVSALWDRWEEPTNHIAIVENITRRKLMEEAVLNSEKEKENILKAMPDTFVLIGADSVIISSYLKCDLTFIQPGSEEVVNGQNYNKALCPSISKIINENLATCLRDQKIIIEQVEIKIIKAINWFELRMVPVNNNLILLIIRDISELKKKTSDNKKFFNIIEQTKELILITDKKGKIEYINPMFSQVTGYQLDEVKGKKPSLFKSNKHNKAFFSELWQTISEGKTFIAEIINRKKNGDLFTEQIIITPLINANGEIINFISTGRDITEEKKRERKILTYQRFEKILEKKEQKYRTLSLMQGQENERKRIAREIHDGLGQMLTVASANLSSIVLKNSESRENKSKFRVVTEMISEIIQESRRISHNLSPVGLYEFGLNAVVSQFVKRINSNFDTIQVIYKSNISETRFKIESEINLYRIIQEAIQNSLKHSQCKVILIDLNYDKGKFKLKIKDDGVGFNLKLLGSDNRHFNGLRNIQERAKIIDCKLNLITEPGKGFEINIELKLKAQ